MTDVITINQIVALIISGILTGAGICLGFIIVGRRFMKEIIKQIPSWIKEIVHEQKKEKAIQRAIDSRRNY